MNDSLIEQAAKRLEQLRAAGAAMPQSDVPAAEDESARTGRRRPPAPTERAARPDSGVVAPVAEKIDLDLDTIAAAGLLTPHGPRTQLADEFRVIKRPLIDNAMGKGPTPVPNGNLIMVTSALPGEGKTFTSINLAMSIAAELDTTVMLVDADVARPSVLNTLGIAPRAGLLDVLVSGSKDLSEVLFRTNVEKLSILPSGWQHPRATELIASDAMVQLLDEMAARYADRVIIFDSPPLLMTTEARALASHMGQLVLVVRAAETPQAVVKHALATVEACPIKMAILNQARGPEAGGYGYGYSYGYGQKN